MATYTLKGTRYIRRYDAPVRTPVYSAASDAAQIAADICNCPWVEIGTAASVFPSHNDKALDANLETRDLFDAANFCTDHQNGMHLAHANVACYKFALPPGASGLTLTSLTARIGCDPYCRDGARVAVNTNDSGVIPTACEECRTGLAHAERVAPRTVSADGGTWYGATADATITPSDAITLGSYLYVFITLETPSYSRDAWLEGAAKALNSFEVALSAAIEGIEDGATIECLYPPQMDHEMMAIAAGWTLARDEGDIVGSMVAFCGLSGGNYTGSDGDFGIREGSIAKGKNFLMALYNELFDGDVVMPVVKIYNDTNDRFNRTRTPGPFFCVRIHNSGGNSGAPTILFTIACGMCIQPIILPSWPVRRIRLRWGTDAWSNELHPLLNLVPDPSDPFASDAGCFRVWIKSDVFVTKYSEQTMRNRAFYDARDGDVVDGWRLLGSIDATRTSGTENYDFDMPLKGRYLSIMLTAWVDIEDMDMYGEPYINSYCGVCHDVSATKETITGGGENGQDEVDVTLNNLSRTFMPQVDLLG